MLFSQCGERGTNYFYRAGARYDKFFTTWAACPLFCNTTLQKVHWDIPKLRPYRQMLEVKSLTAMASRIMPKNLRIR